MGKFCSQSGIKASDAFKSIIVIDNAGIEKLPEYKNFGTTLQKLSDIDYPNKYIFSHDIKGINADELKCALFPGKAINSVDAIIGISDYDDAKNKTSNHRLLLIELRMGYKKGSNISCTDLISKVHGTKKCLAINNIYEKSILFIFDNSFIQRAKNLFNRFRNQGGDSKFFYAYSVSEFNDTICDLNDNFVHKVKYNQKDIFNKLKEYLSEGDLSGLHRSVNYWIETAKKERYNNYNIHEYNNIVQVLSDFKTFFYTQEVDHNSDEFIKIYILFEDEI